MTAYFQDCTVGSATTTHTPTNGLYVHGPLRNENLSGSGLLFSDGDKILTTASISSPLGNLTFSGSTLSLRDDPTWTNQTIACNSATTALDISGFQSSTISADVYGIRVGSWASYSGSKYSPNIFHVLINNECKSTGANESTNEYGLYIDNKVSSMVTNKWGLYVKTPTGATNNVCAEFEGDVKVNGQTLIAASSGTDSVTMYFNSLAFSTTLSVNYRIVGKTVHVSIPSYVYASGNNTSAALSTIAAAYRPAETTNFIVSTRNNNALTVGMLIVYSSTGNLNIYPSATSLSTNFNGICGWDTPIQISYRIP